MSTKVAEADFAKMCARLNIWCHKWSNIRVCPSCGFKIFKRLSAEEDMRPEESRETIVDYLIFLGSYPSWVECKGQPGQERLPFKDIDPKQRNFLNSWTDRKVSSMLFLTLGNGRPAPKGRKAWLFPWWHWLSFEQEWIADGMKSIPWAPTKFKADTYTLSDEVYKDYELVWDYGGWMIPETHILVMFYKATVDILHMPPLY